MKRKALLLLIGLIFWAGCAPGIDDAGQADADLAEIPFTIPDTTAEEDIAWQCPENQALFVTDRLIFQEVPVEKPARGEVFLDAVYGACLVRVTDHLVDLPGYDDEVGLKNEYSRVQSFNADDSLIMVRSTEADYLLYDARSLERLGQLPPLGEPRWSNLDPHLIYHLEELKLRAYDVSNGVDALVHDFSDLFTAQRISALWTRWEGRQSSDDRYWAFMAEDQDWNAAAFLVYDLVNDRIVGFREVDPPADVDNVTISPLGSYFIAQFEPCQHGSMGSLISPCGLMVYNQSLQDGRGYLRIIGHADTALDALSREVFVFQDIDTDSISMLDMETGEKTDLLPIDFSFCAGCGVHFSGLGYLLPGWTLVSYFDGDAATRMWMDDHIFAVKLARGGKVVRFAQHHSLVDPRQKHDYWAEPHASVNRDFTRILFTSNWNSSGDSGVDMYMVILPPDWYSQQ